MTPGVEIKKGLFISCLFVLGLNNLKVEEPIASVKRHQDGARPLYYHYIKAEVRGVALKKKEVKSD